MFVHGPSRICAHPSLMPTETFALVLTGGKSRGCEKSAAVWGAFEVAVASGAVVKRVPMAAKAAPIISANKALRCISQQISTRLLSVAVPPELDVAEGWAKLSMY